MSRKLFEIKRKTKTLQVENCEVTIQELSEADTRAIAAAEAKGDDVMHIVLIGGVIDEDGKPCFTANDKKEIDKLPIRVVKQIAEEITKLSGVNDPLELS